MASFHHEIELHGNRLGLTEKNELVVNARPIGSVSRNRYIELFDDFLGDTVNVTYAGDKGNDGAATNAALVTAGTGGIMRLVTGANLSADVAGNGVQFGSSLNFNAGNGFLMMEAKVKISAITNVSVFVGFTDRASGTLEMPIQAAVPPSGNTLLSTATDAVGFMFDTAMSTDNIWCVGVDRDTDATAINTGLAFVADTYKVLRVELVKNSASTIAYFYIDGGLVGRMTAACGSDVNLTPYIGGFALAAASRNIDTDYIHLGMDRV